ncbi:MAG: Fic family protein [Myxococcales bacterium]|nr:Fic family protein [Myxococcales bacterium]
MREDTPTPDASERHLALRASLARQGHAPPLAAKTALAAFDARAPSDEAPSACLTEYTLRVDAPAHDDPARNERTLRAMSEPLFSEGILGILQDDPRSLETWMGALLGLSGRASLRTRESYARGGTHTYSTLEGALAERWTAGFSAEVFALHPVIRGARWYFDAIFLHPFDDGNARLARALLVFSIEGRVDLAPLVWLPKRPGSAEDFWRFVTVCALQSVARDRRRYHERTLR